MKKLLAGLLVMVLMVSLFVGCTKEETQTTVPSNDATGSNEVSEPTPENQAVELRIVTMFGGTDPATAVFEQQLADFMLEFPHVTVKNESMTAVGDEFRTAVKTDFATGNEADITFFFTGADMKGIIESGGVVPIETIQQDYPEVGADIALGVLMAMRESDGKIYALPMTGFYEGLFVNEAIFEQYDLELPTTWDNLLKAIEVLNDNGITPFAGPLAQSHYMIEHFVYAQAGPELYNSLLEDGAPQEWVDGLENIRVLYEMGAFSADALTMDIEMAQNLFKQERAAMILEGSWFIGGCEDALRDQMTVVPFPTSPGGKKSDSAVVAGFTTGYHVSTSAYNNTDKQQAVVDLLNHLTSKESIAAIAKANGGTPSADVIVEGLHPVYLDGNAMVAKASDLHLPIDSRIVPEAFNYIVNEGVPFIAYGQRTAEEVLTEVARIQNNR